jgi:hypothetical protein
VVEYKIQYDGAGAAQGTSGCQLSAGSGLSKVCTLTFHTDADMNGPVYVYYELDNFYQNHRRYVKSRSDLQLAGTIYTSASDSGISDCDPLTSRGGRVLHPCGLVANSYFNDTFALSPGSNFTMNEKDISWASDRSKKFVAISQADQIKYASQVVFINETYPGVGNVDNEHFIVWMRPAALPNFRKLYGRIEKDIPAGSQLKFDVTAHYPVSGFDGKKSLVISTLSFMGGKNPFLGVAYIVVGVLCLAMAGVFAVKQRFGARKLGDTTFLVYNTARR